MIFKIFLIYFVLVVSEAQVQQNGMNQGNGNWQNRNQVNSNGAYMGSQGTAISASEVNRNPDELVTDPDRISKLYKPPQPVNYDPPVYQNQLVLRGNAPLSESQLSSSNLQKRADLDQNRPVQRSNGQRGQNPWRRIQYRPQEDVDIPQKSQFRYGGPQYEASGSSSESQSQEPHSAEFRHRRRPNLRLDERKWGTHAIKNNYGTVYFINGNYLDRKITTAGKAEINNKARASNIMRRIQELKRQNNNIRQQVQTVRNGQRLNGNNYPDRQDGYYRNPNRLQYKSMSPNSNEPANMANRDAPNTNNQMTQNGNYKGNFNSGFAGQNGMGAPGGAGQPGIWKPNDFQNNNNGNRGNPNDGSQISQQDLLEAALTEDEAGTTDDDDGVGELDQYQGRAMNGANGTGIETSTGKTGEKEATATDDAVTANPNQDTTPHVPTETAPAQPIITENTVKTPSDASTPVEANSPVPASQPGVVEPAKNTSTSN